MPHQPMTDDEAREFLAGQPARPGVIATTRKDGRPHVAPVWYVVDDDGSIVFTTGADTVKGRTLRRTGWAAMTVDDDRPPFSFVMVEGPVTVSDDLDEVGAWAARIAGRYMGEARAAEYGARNGVPGELLVRLVPTNRVTARDVAD